MGYHSGIPNNTDNIVFCVDANNIRSYPGSGTTLFDIINANNGTITGATISGGVLVLDGAGDYVDHGDVSQVEGITAMTIEGWIKSDAAGTASDEGIISRDSAGTRSWYLAVTTGNVFKFFISDDGSTSDTLSSVATFTTGVWYHVAVTWDGANMEIFINGVSDNTAASSNATGALPDIAESLKIGRRQAAEYFTGSAGLWKIHAAVLPDADIKNSYLAGLSRAEYQ